jgi:hypothetical protein
MGPAAAEAVILDTHKGMTAPPTVSLLMRPHYVAVERSAEPVGRLSSGRPKRISQDVVIELSEESTMAS